MNILSNQNLPDLRLVEIDHCLHMDRNVEEQVCPATFDFYNHCQPLSTVTSAKKKKPEHSHSAFS